MKQTRDRIDRDNMYGTKRYITTKMFLGRKKRSRLQTASQRYIFATRIARLQPLVPKSGNIIF